MTTRREYLKERVRELYDRIDRAETTLADLRAIVSRVEDELAQLDEKETE